eukprot:453791-Prymnesium_polylepis.1
MRSLYGTVGASHHGPSHAAFVSQAFKARGRASDKRQLGAARIAVRAPSTAADRACLSPPQSALTGFPMGTPAGWPIGTPPPIALTSARACHDEIASTRCDATATAGEVRGHGRKR